RAERLHARVREPVELDAGFSVLIMLTGKAVLRTEHAGELVVKSGDTVVIPHHAGASTVDGEATAIRCRPPQPRARAAGGTR
ncbi:MAG: mannose-6-phosphate isomerase, partial [Sciscionella sp.]|nr:mannose-6-phosphate isomerase [Sciscionella sp.]